MRDGANDVLHLWGGAAGEPDADRVAVAGFRARHDSRGPDVVVTPSYWGGRRRELLAEALLEQGVDAHITDIATDLMAGEPPVTEHCVLVELEPRRMCASRLDYGAGLADSRLVHASGDRLAAIFGATADLLADVSATPSGDSPGTSGDDGEGASAPAGAAGGVRCAGDVFAGNVEFIIAGGAGYLDVVDDVVAGLRRRGHLVYPVPVGELGRVTEPPPEAYPPLAMPPVGLPASGDGAPSPGLPAGGRVRGAVDEPLDIGALRTRAKAGLAASESNRLRAPAGVLAGAMVVAAALIVVVMVTSGGQRPGVVGGEGAGADAVAAAAAGGAGGDGAGAADEAAREPDPPGHVLRHNGIQVTLPMGWRLDDTARPDVLVAVDGGPMRILVTAATVAEGMTLDVLEDGLVARVAGDPTADRVRRDVIDGLEVVVHEERPGDGSVVLWQHRIVGASQLSVGCQWRDATIPQLRPVCGRALRTAGVAEGP